MSLETIRRFYNRISNSVYHFYYYASVVDKRRIFFGNPELADQVYIRIRRPFLFVILPCMWMVIFAIRGSLVLYYEHLTDTEWKKLVWFTAFMPEGGRRNYEFTLLLWSVLYILYVMYVTQTNLLDFKVLAVINVSYKSNIKPFDLGLFR